MIFGLKSDYPMAVPNYAATSITVMMPCLLGSSGRAAS
jgi:predicted transcriptional regulator